MAAAIYAVFMIAAWSGFYAGWWVLPVGGDPVFWHAREMIFGFSLAVIAGFLLTAVANWTGWAPVRGGHLAGLLLLWMAGRALMLLPVSWAATGVALADAVFLLALIISLGVPLARRRNGRDAVVLGVLVVFLALDVALWAEPALELVRAGVLTVSALIVLIGGRIIPAFAVAGLRQRGLAVFQTDQPRLDMACFILSLTAVAGAAFFGVEAPWSRGVFFMLGVLLAMRMRHYHAVPSLALPMLWILHAGHVWIVIGYVLLALGAPVPLAIHALTAGGIGSLCLGMMTRVALGHTGRDPCSAPRLMTWAFVAVQMAAIFRVFGCWVFPGFISWVLPLSGFIWAACFAGYLAVVGPMLLAPRPDGRPA